MFRPLHPSEFVSPPILVIVARLFRIDMDNEMFCSHIYKTKAQTLPSTCIFAIRQHRDAFQPGTRL